MAGEVTFTPTEVDYVDANRDWYAQWLRSRRAKRGMLIQMLICSGIGAAAGLFDLDVDPDRPWALALGFALMTLVLLPIMHGMNYLLIPIRARRLYRQQKNLRDEFRYGWGDAGISYDGASGRGCVPWHDLHGWAA